MPLTDREKEKVRYHMGYLGVASAASIQFGMPSGQQTLFLLENAMSNLMEVSIDRVRRLIDVLESLETTMIEAQGRLTTSSIEEIKFRDAEPQRLEQEYVRWAQRLSDVLGVPLYPLSQRFAAGVGNTPGGSAGNIPVV